MENFEKGIVESARGEAVKGLLTQSFATLAMLQYANNELLEIENGDNADKEKLAANKRMEIRTHQHNYDMQIAFAKIVVDYKV